MAGEFFKHLVRRAKKAAQALKAKFTAVTRTLLPPARMKKFLTPGISCGTGNALHRGKRYRLTSDHAPVFSLFTFFGNRQ
jgi:hypothetical protein